MKPQAEIELFQEYAALQFAVAKITKEKDAADVATGMVSALTWVLEDKLPGPEDWKEDIAKMRKLLTGSPEGRMWLVEQVMSGLQKSKS